MQTGVSGKPIRFAISNNLLHTWKPCEGQLCDPARIQLSMSRAAPAGPDREQRPPPPRPVKIAPPLRTRTEPQDDVHRFIATVDRILEARARFKAWANKPAPPPPPATVPPFDLQDVPKAMRKMHMPMAARLQERWFAGYENYSLTEQDLWDEIDQHGHRYTRSMVDDTTIKMDWVLRFPRAHSAFDELVGEKVRNPAAITALRTLLFAYRNFHSIDAWQEAGSDFYAYHRAFQFQRFPVSSTWGQKIAGQLDRSLRFDGIPDELMGTLGSFSFYAAVQSAWFHSQYPAAIVTHIAVYIRDPYEFSDDQYLGHWNAHHVAVVPAHQLTGGNGWLDYPLTQGSVYEKHSVLYPVTNRHYRDWRALHRRGGDFMIYSDRLVVKLQQPIWVTL